MKTRSIILSIILAVVVLYSQAQSREEVAILKNHANQFVGVWGVKNDSLDFSVTFTLEENSRPLPDEPFLQFLGKYNSSYRKSSKGNYPIISEGVFLRRYYEVQQTLFNLDKRLHKLGLSFTDPITGNACGVSIELVGENALELVVWGRDRKVILDENGNPIGGQIVPEEYSIPRRMVLYRK